MTGPESTKTCHFCGMPIGAGLFVRDGSRYCCKSCYLPCSRAAFRPYRPARTFDDARVEILHGCGTQFDPHACEAFVDEEAVLREMVGLKCGGAIMRTVTM